MFTEHELAYLRSQPLGRVATAQPGGLLQVSPVGFRYNPETRTIDIGGYRMERSRKYRNVAANGQVAFVVDDLASVRPWRPRFVEVRGWGEVVPDEGAERMSSGARVGGALIRIHPQRIISAGIEPLRPGADPMKPFARDVGDATQP
jgi:pyridoxamine 5'-phosphate oxidase family protein